MTIKEPGVYEIPADAYHADPTIEPSLSASVANVILSHSPLHAWAKHPRLNPDFEPEEKPQFDLGSAAHNMVLRQNFWREEIAVVEAQDWKTKAAKEARETARAAGRHPVQRAGIRDAVVAKVQLVGAELVGIVGKPLLLGQAFRIDRPDPILVTEAACAD